MRQFDFIIVGSGLAGLNAALHASAKGSVLLVTKKNLEASNTWYAQGGIAAVGSKKDSVKEHVQDTLKAGAYHNDRKAVEFMIKQGWSAVQRLKELGVHFNPSLHREGGHSIHRIFHCRDHTGMSIEETLIKQVKKNKSITIFENTFVKDLLVRRKTCVGIQIFTKTKIENIFGKIVILATGGVGEIYRKTTNPAIATGDGIAMAWRAGAKLKDLEFIQFHPTAFDSHTRPLFLLTEALRGAGAQLYTLKKERFMLRYHPDAELAPRDIVSRSIFQEQKNGSISLRLMNKKIAQGFPSINSHLKKAGYDLKKDFIPVTPAAHFSCGGISTDLRGRTSIKNLYALGEVAHTGLHGANRLASNSLLEAVVMSNQITKIRVPKIQIPKIPTEKLERINKTEQKNLQKIRKDLQSTMWKYGGIVRNQEGLKKAIRLVDELENELPQKLHPSVMEVVNMVQTSQLILKAALKREKSLGTHYII